MIKIETAIKKLERNYQLALKNDYVRDKVAWSLYLTWKEVEQAHDGEIQKKHLTRQIER